MRGIFQTIGYLDNGQFDKVVAQLKQIGRNKFTKPERRSLVKLCRADWAWFYCNLEEHSFQHFPVTVLATLDSLGSKGVHTVRKAVGQA